MQEMNMHNLPLLLFHIQIFFANIPNINYLVGIIIITLTLIIINLLKTVLSPMISHAPLFPLLSAPVCRALSFFPAYGFVCFLNDFFICKGIDEADHAKDITSRIAARKLLADFHRLDNLGILLTFMRYSLAKV